MRWRRCAIGCGCRRSLPARDERPAKRIIRLERRLRLCDRRSCVTGESSLRCAYAIAVIPAPTPAYACAAEASAQRLWHSSRPPFASATIWTRYRQTYVLAFCAS
ncbi:hypothetical protein [Lysobacter gummosus]|uniref:hypothetical protein n=1 Tax=Lysobacter gummosus TaxID=262324 RepID=UPI003638C8C3